MLVQCATEQEIRRFDGRRTPGLIRRPGARGGNNKSESSSLEAALSQSLFAWLRPDSNVTVGTVTQLVDKVLLPASGGLAGNARSFDANHAFTQATAGKQLAAIANSALMAGQPAANFNGGPFYASTLAAAPWKFSYDGSGFDIYLVFNPNSLSAAVAGWSTFVSGAVAGSWCFPFLTNGKPQITSKNSAGTTIYDSSGTGQGLAVPAGALSYMSVSGASADTPDVAIRQRGEVVYQSADGIVFPTLAGTQTMLLGCLNAAGANPLNALVGDFLVANRSDAALRTKIERYIELRYGLRRQETTLAVGDSQMVNMDPTFKIVRPSLSGKDLTFTNQAISGTTSTNWAVGSTNYNNAKGQFLAGKRFPKALLIELGTNDAKDPVSGSAGSTWTNNITAMIAQFRTDLALPNLPVVLVVMPATVPSNVPSLPGETFSNWASIRAAQLALSVSGVTLVQAPDGPYIDNLHLTDPANAVLAGLISPLIA